MEKKKKLSPYWPLFALVLVAFLAATALSCGVQGGLFIWMHFFMGFFLCQFAMLKLFHPADFVQGFRMYDLVAKKSQGYAYLYPFIELGLGLSYLSFIYPTFVYSITIVVMGVGTIGVVRALKAGLNVRCACMGTILDVPLSTVTLSEDITMGAMALLMLLTSF
jgi:hypothetical protein